MREKCEDDGCEICWKQKARPTKLQSQEKWSSIIGNRKQLLKCVSNLKKGECAMYDLDKHRYVAVKDFPLYKTPFREHWYQFWRVR